MSLSLNEDGGIQMLTTDQLKLKSMTCQKVLISQLNGKIVIGRNRPRRRKRCNWRMRRGLVDELCNTTPGRAAYP